ncbi:MAG TPA: SurA N-terminal domain-containing protein [Steroidobacteraceae bacterium]|nr:SurA N-terminal domain-containing protein [Steroidobacteraceae bacterium]
MLQSIHDKISGWFAYVMLGAIGLVFVFWGINWTLSTPNYAAKVNGVEISSNEVRQAYQQRLAQVERQRGDTPLDESERNAIKKQVLDEFVNSEALVTREDELGYRVSDQDVLAAMAQIPALQNNGKFDPTHAAAILRSQGRSLAEIEGYFKHDLKLRQLDTALGASSFVTKTEVKHLEALMRQQREIRWITLPAAKYAATATPSDADLKAYYEAHKADYMTPETVNLRYVEVNLNELAAQVPIDEAKVRAYYEEQKAKTPEQFMQPEKRHLAHILLQVSDSKEDAAVKAKAEALAKRAKEGEDFAKLAQANSQDPGSAGKGGDLGWAERKAYVAEFANAAFSMKDGEISAPIKTQFGYHIIKVEGIQPPSTKTFEEARAELENDYRRTEAERLFNDAQDRLADAALQSGTDIASAARKAGLTVHEIDNFSRTEGGGELGKVPAVLQAAFSQDVLDGHLSSMIEVDKGRGVVLQASDHKLPAQKPLEAVRDQVVAAWKRQRGAELAQAAAHDAVKALEGGKPWDSVAQGLGESPPAPKFVSRSEASVPMSVRRDAFDAPKPEGKPVYSSVLLDNGDAAVLELTAVREDPSAQGVAPEAQLKREFAQVTSATEAQAYQAAARADAKVQLNLPALD